ncbi:MAG: V4R domain-containing protein [Pseudanabaenaceae cyanobacterium bins.68]|nr:V4R domain-containing protein [Pseudanabaenaceae cyanobacterium bins.68]
MISVAELLSQPNLAANYFSYDTYLRGDLEIGILENRRGDRLLAIPDTLLSALYAGVEKETGQASRLVLVNCGKWWGKNFYKRFLDAVTDYYQATLSEMDMATFLGCLQECWKTHGWGRIDLDATHQKRGFLMLKTTNSPYAKPLETATRPSCYVEAGILTAFFANLTSRDLEAVQISCESLGADCNRFVLGLSDRLRSVDTLIEEGLDWQAIMQRLLTD